MNNKILSLLLFCLCFGLEYVSFQIVGDYFDSLNLMDNTLAIILFVVLSLLYIYLYSVLLEKFLNIDAKKTMIRVLIFCLCFALNYVSLTVVMDYFYSLMLIHNKLVASLINNPLVAIILFVIITLLYGCLYSVLLKRFSNEEYSQIKSEFIIRKYFGIALLIFIALVLYNIATALKLYG
ncbi:hypothetical protein [Bacillus cereus group sp. TH152-1LC]|uniref:hypothetical protein n=1 Tax=Bacillus cereus group sp. TH152-1LC TaxID=3018060 RepID=UPI0022E2DB6F|nr:hypothetical protein [Bacillus cereus group sp. TH152-1LC]MDA1675605.1 hypothetical protein [Bacillus cereus group sp. TH152-1LC]